MTPRIEILARFPSLAAPGHNIVVVRDGRRFGTFFAAAGHEQPRRDRIVQCNRTTALLHWHDASRRGEVVAPFPVTS